MAEPVKTLPAPSGKQSGLEKAAVLLLTMGPEAASKILQHLNDTEVKQLSAAIARQRTIPKLNAAQVQEEAWRKLTNREGVYVDGEQFAKQLISSAHGGAGQRDERSSAARELQRATAGAEKWLASSLEAVAPPLVAQMVANEHPQVIAFILAHLNPRQAALVLGQLPEEVQSDIIQRVADLQGVSDELLVEVGDLLQEQVQGLGRGAQAPVDGNTGTKRAAEIMNAVDKTVEGRVFAQLESEAPELAEKIREQMFTFEDMIQLDNRGMQVVLKEIAREDLMLALKTASPAMRDKIFANISARAAEILRDDMSTMGPVRLKDVEKAQGNIIAVVRRLQGEQKIVIGGGSGDDVLV
jgi:flagellar motor switch protein FliG